MEVEGSCLAALNGLIGAILLAMASLPPRQPVEGRTNWTLPRLRAEIERQAGASIPAVRLSVLLKNSRGPA